MHQVVSHDLPNQLVAVQGLLQLLSLEEADRLSEEGREYLRRLHNATRRGAELARFLKEMERLRTFTVQSTTIGLADLARELQGELQQRFPTKVFEFKWQWHEPQAVGDPRVLSQAIRELLIGLIPAAASHCRISASSNRQGKAIELAFCLEDAQGSTPADQPAPPFEQRLEVILAREWLALLNTALELAESSGNEVRFSILIPNQ
jgi:light-regulated signal transduction histidine kinase (bacteriophytochrome)